MKYFLKLIDLFEIQYIECIGRKSEKTIKSLGLNIKCEYLRHPFCGGKMKFIDNIKNYMEKI